MHTLSILMMCFSVDQSVPELTELAHDLESNDFVETCKVRFNIQCEYIIWMLEQSIYEYWQIMQI